jgi:UDP-N-acetylmuramyl pentapeptide phosphotransferase/UDP-N-acetylglucosamine-1-phosphate transferase
MDYHNFLYLFLFSILLNYSFIRLQSFFSIKQFKQIHDTHNGNISRHGGVIIFFCLLIFTVINNQTNILKILIISLITLLPAFLEDVRFNIKPTFRLFLILITSLIIIFQIEELPSFEMGFLNVILNNDIFKIIFYTISLTCLINGQNIIDGTNGLGAFTSLIIFFSVLYLGLIFNDNFLIKYSLFLIFLIIAFLLFNFPFGKIFLGDLGSYFLGLFSGYLIIYVFGKYPELSTWLACIILFYPVFEAMFSYVRKIFMKVSPFYPDLNHLHLMLYSKLSKSNYSMKNINPFVTLILIVVWLLPFVAFILSIKFWYLTLPSLFILVLIYVSLYFYLMRSLK